MTTNNLEVVAMDKNNALMTAGQILRRARRRLDKSQIDIAKRLGLTPSVVCRYESDVIKIQPFRTGEVIIAYELTPEEKDEFLKLIGVQVGSYPTRRHGEFRIFYELIMLPKEERQRIIKAAIAYDSVSES